MLMSEAIRLGAMLRPQCQAFLFAKGRSCAIGSAFEAIGVHPPVECVVTYANIADFTGSKESYWCRLLSKNREDWPTLTRIAMRNDNGETREAIADWLVESGNDFEVSPLPKIEVELSPADVAAIQEVTHG